MLRWTFRSVVLTVILALAAMAPLAAGGPAESSPAPSGSACQARVNNTAQKLLQCINSQSLWSHLAIFQQIADENPGPGGHGNRDTGTSGYRASVAYVAGVMQQAGYRVSIQTYTYTTYQVTGTPQFGSSQRNYALAQDWFVARLSAAGTLIAAVQPAAGNGDGCAASELNAFTPGNVALLQRGDCSYDVQVANASAARAAAVILYNRRGNGAFPARLTRPPAIPVVSASYAVGSDLARQYQSGAAPLVHLDIRTQAKSGLDYNLIADSPYGDPRHVVVVDAHLDSIFGAGMLDNASGSATILEMALAMANTPTRNQLRYIWFGGEELGLLGSAYYTTHLSRSQLRRIAFDVDADVTATPNYDYLVADPRFASNVRRFPPNVVPESAVGNQFLAQAFQMQGMPSRPAWFGNDGTDSNSFSLAGVPNTGVLTQQDCCKGQRETSIWGGVPGNYEGKIPSFNGGCVDYPGRWCDNLPNNDPRVLQTASRAVAYTVFDIANYPFPGDWP